MQQIEHKVKQFKWNSIKSQMVVHWNDIQNSEIHESSKFIANSKQNAGEQQQ